MKSKLTIYIILCFVILNACQKKNINFKKGEYEFTITEASYFFEGNEYSLTISPVTIILSAYSTTELTFDWRTVNSWGAVLDSTSQLQVSGDQIQGLFFDYQLTGNSEIVDKKMMINGDVNFTKIHDYICTSGPFSYPCSAEVNVNGKFSIKPLWD